MQQPPQVPDAPVTLVPLVVNDSPSTLDHVSYARPPPPGFTDADLGPLNQLARLLLSSPGQVFPGKPEPVPNQRSTEVNQHKMVGNDFFQRREYPEAIKHYTLSADKAAARPLFEANVYARDELAITICNRSAAYFLMGNHLEALVDANAVIALKRPWVKGHFRRGKALQGLGRLEEAREAYLLGLQFDPTAEVSARDRTSVAVTMVLTAAMSCQDLSNGVAEVDKLLQERFQASRNP